MNEQIFLGLVVFFLAWWWWRSVWKVIEARDLDRYDARRKDREHLEDLFNELGTRIEQALSDTPSGRF